MMEEKQKQFYNVLNSMPNKEYMELYLLYSLAPVIAGFKPSSTINFKSDYRELYSQWNLYGKDFIEKLGLNYISLRDQENYIVVLIYKKETLKNYLLQDNNIDFLKRLGYDESKDLEQWLETLKVRYDRYHCPHEIGLFLGIPIEDVIDFMDCTDKKCLMCGYWKVYNDCYKAKKIFNDYDNSKQYVVNSILEGRSTLSLVNDIQTNFLKFSI